MSTLTGIIYPIQAIRAMFEHNERIRLDTGTLHRMGDFVDLTSTQWPDAMKQFADRQKEQVAAKYAAWKAHMLGNARQRDIHMTLMQMNIQVLRHQLQYMEDTENKEMRAMKRKYNQLKDTHVKLLHGIIGVGQDDRARKRSRTTIK
jgi:hypothetical protein